MIPALTQDETERLRELLRDLSIAGTNGIIVNRTGWARFTVSDARPVRKAVQNGGGGSDLFRVRLELDPTTAALTGSATTQCGFRYFAYPVDAAFPFDPNFRLPIGAASPSRIDYRGHMSVGPYVAAASNTFGHAFYDGTDLRLFAWKEQPRAEACT